MKDYFNDFQLYAQFKPKKMSLRIHCFYKREARDDDTRTYLDQAQANGSKRNFPENFSAPSIFASVIDTATII